MTNLHIRERITNTWLYSKIANIGSTSILLAASILTALLVVTPTVSADVLGYPYPTDTEAPCEFAPNGGASCTNPNDSSDKYDWGVWVGTVFHPYRNGFEYRNCTDYVQWKESTSPTNISVPSSFGNGGQWYNNAPTTEQSTTPLAWDAAVVPGNPGHVAFVESVNTDGTITVSEYNQNGQGTGDKRTGTASSMGFTKFVDFGVHPVGGNVTAVAYANIGGVYNVFWGTDNGTINNTYWGNGTTLGTSSEATGLDHITSVAFYNDNGVYHVISGTTTGKIYDTFWGNGTNPQTVTKASQLGTVNSIALQVVNGVYNVVSGTSGGYVYDTYWGNGTNLGTSIEATGLGTINAVAFYLDGSTYNVFEGTNDGIIYSTYWASGGSSTTNEKYPTPN